MTIITVDSKAIIKVRDDALEAAAKIAEKQNYESVPLLIRKLKNLPVELVMKGKK